MASSCARGGANLCPLQVASVMVCVCVSRNISRQNFWRLCCLCWCVLSLLGCWCKTPRVFLLWESCMLASLLWCRKSAKHKLVQFCFGFSEKAFCQKFVECLAYSTTFLHIPAKSQTFSDVPLLHLRKFAPNCFVLFWGLLWWVLLLFLAAYFHDGWRRGLDYNNQENKDKIIQQNRAAKHQTL